MVVESGFCSEELDSKSKVLCPDENPADPADPKEIAALDSPDLLSGSWLSTAAETVSVFSFTEG